MTTTIPPNARLEEPEDAALRLALGLRPIIFEFDDPVIDPRPCPSWCTHVARGGVHDIDPKRPFDAHHPLGWTPTVALSLYAGTCERPSEDAKSFYKLASSLMVRLGQTGQDAPVISIDGSLSAPGDLRLDLSPADVADLIAALQYVVDLAEGRRRVVEGTE